VSFVFAQVFVLQSVLKLSFPLVVLIASFGDSKELFYCYLLIFLERKW
jgi:hypothetical protein